MTTQPEALRLAELLKDYHDGCEDEGPTIFSDAAAELRRLHEISEHKGRLICDLDNQINSLERTKEELLEALRVAVCEIADWGSYSSEYFQNKHDLKGAISRANAAIAKATA